jgi:hypothetical protein
MMRLSDIDKVQQLKCRLTDLKVLQQKIVEMSAGAWVEISFLHNSNAHAVLSLQQHGVDLSRLLRKERIRMERELKKLGVSLA